jgi:hypothetical protein
MNSNAIPTPLQELLIRASLEGPDKGARYLEA